MHKKIVMLTGAVFMALAFHACTLPSAIEVRLKPQLDMPVDPQSANMGKMLVDNIKTALKNGNPDITVLDYVDGHKKDGKAIQTFLVRYSIDPDDGINFDITDQLNLVNDLDFDTDVSDLNPEIDSDNLKKLGNPDIDPVIIELDLKEPFERIEDDINAGFKTGNNLLETSLPIKPTGQTTNSPTIDWDGNEISFTVIMDEAEFYAGKFYAKIEIGSASEAPDVFSGAKITFNNITLAMTDKPDDTIVGKDENGNTEITLTQSAPSKELVFDLKDKTLDGKFHVNIGSYSDTRTPASSGGFVKLTVKPDRVEGLEFRRITGLKMTKSYDITFEPKFIDIGLDGDSSFVQAKIDTGKLVLERKLPPKGQVVSNFFDSDGNVVDYEVDITQADNLDYPLYKDGLDITCTLGEKNLFGCYINPEMLKISSNKFISFSSEEETSFEINDADLAAGKVTLEILPTLSISLFEEVHLDIKNQLDKLKNKVSAISLDKAVEYLDRIQFVEVGPVITFGEVTIPDLTLSIQETNLYINKTEPIVSNTAPEFVNKNPPVLDLNSVTELNFEVEVRQAGRVGTVITVYDVNPMVPNIKFTIDGIELIKEWEWMDVKPDQFAFYDGSFPGKDKAPIDFSSLEQYLKGFIFMDVKSYLYISGPPIFFKLRPNVTMNMAWRGQPPISLPIDNNNLKNAKPFPDLETPEEFAGELPRDGQIDVDLSPALEALPPDLSFAYIVKVEETRIYQTMLDEMDDLNNPLKLEILFKVPLVLEAGEDGADIFLSNLDDSQPGSEKKDLLSRTKDNNTFRLDWIKNLDLKLEFTDSMFDGAILLLEDGEKVIKFNLAGRTMNLPIESADLEYINDTIPYRPDVKIHFDKGKPVAIPRGLGITRIQFDAEMVIKYDLPGGNK